MGLFWEEFKIGDTFRTEEVVITSDLVNQFAKISGDDNPVHINEKSARDSIYKGVVAHGMLIISLFTGLNRKLGILKGTSLGVVHVEWDFIKPVYINDTIFYLIEIVDKRETSKKDRGILRRKINTFRTDGTKVGQGVFVNLVKRLES